MPIPKIRRGGSGSSQRKWDITGTKMNTTPVRGCTTVRGSFFSTVTQTTELRPKLAPPPINQGDRMDRAAEVTAFVSALPTIDALLSKSCPETFKAIAT